MDSESSSKSSGAFLLAQLGSHAAKQFAERLSPLKLLPQHAGILRMLDRSSGLSQRDLAARLGIYASRLVAILDEMESLGFVVREGNVGDRRTYSLRLTPKGREMLAEIAKISREHNESVFAALTLKERDALTGVLQRVADQQGLTRGVHPGYSRLGGETTRIGTTGDIEPKRADEAS
ncbi:MarR family winged helix-turn-helix transcriptional regulator [Tunturiibacter gelidoferens]|uniref:DNA-binding MarR family transcriptional regulator n=1 Tax=Tunturiibacter gelidiferens TaxID=3069689 RepID=A0A9X0U1R6_9BACT|nr:MarR family winged helix-turn-helix transcriptional regulator [Edaphobacter lichenicola]MBB5326721.1 DNA-binding MarR family transcriptional regulator [Edaphobacter lichenicola]